MGFADQNARLADSPLEGSAFMNIAVQNAQPSPTVPLRMFVEHAPWSWTLPCGVRGLNGRCYPTVSMGLPSAHGLLQPMAYPAGKHASNNVRLPSANGFCSQPAA